MKTIEFTIEQSRVVMKFLSGLSKNQTVTMREPLLLASETNLIDEVAKLAKKFGEPVFTDVTTTLVKQTVWRVTSIDMATEMVEDLGCHLVFNEQ